MNCWAHHHDIIGLGDRLHKSTQLCNQPRYAQWMDTDTISARIIGSRAPPLWAHSQSLRLTRKHEHHPSGEIAINTDRPLGIGGAYINGSLDTKEETFLIVLQKKNPRSALLLTREKASTTSSKNSSHC
jgi:hypothetical protein